MTNSTILTIVLISSVVSFFAIPYFVGLADRFGRRLLYLVGVVGISAFLLFWATDTGSFWLTLAAHIFGLGSLSVAYGPQAAFYAEMFGTRVRYSGISLGYQGGSIFGGALAPFNSYLALRFDRCLDLHRRVRGGARRAVVRVRLSGDGDLPDRHRGRRL